MCAGVIASGRAWGWGGLAATRVDGKAGLLTTIRMITGSLTFFSEWVTEQIPLCFFFFLYKQEKNCIWFITLSFYPFWCVPTFLLNPAGQWPINFIYLCCTFCAKDDNKGKTCRGKKISARLTFFPSPLQKYFDFIFHAENLIPILALILPLALNFQKVNIS